MKEGDSKSALSQHQVLNKPMIEGIRVIDSDNRNLHIKVKEAVHIKLRKATLNRMGGYDLPHLYLPLLREEARGAGRE